MNSINGLTRLKLSLFICATLMVGDLSLHAAALDVPSGGISFVLSLNEESNSDVTLSGVPAGFDVSNTTYLGWCVDMDTEVELNSTLQGRLFDLSAVPAYLNGIDWNRLLYILNH